MIATSADYPAEVDLVDRYVGFARRMLGGCPAAEWSEQVHEASQAAVVRLARFPCVDYWIDTLDGRTLACDLLRRELIDLARLCRGRLVAGPALRADAVGGEPLNPTEAGRRAYILGLWLRFHDLVTGLPQADREAFELCFYLGVPQNRAAEILGLRLSKVRRNWQAAFLRLYSDTGGELSTMFE